MISVLRSRAFLAAWALSLSLTGFPGVGAQDAPLPGKSRIFGEISAMDGKTRVPGAVVVAYHLATEHRFESEPSNAKGEFEIVGLPAGYYELAVRTPEGLYVGSSVVNVAPARKTRANMFIVPLEALRPEESLDERALPEATQSAAGAARVERRQTQREFWRSPKGVAILAGGGTAVLLAIVTADDERAVSGF